MNAYEKMTTMFYALSALLNQCSAITENHVREDVPAAGKDDDSYEPGNFYYISNDEYLALSETCNVVRMLWNGIETKDFGDESKTIMNGVLDLYPHKFCASFIRDESLKDNDFVVDNFRKLLYSLHHATYRAMRQHPENPYDS